jgi:hypothetical protein
MRHGWGKLAHGPPGWQASAGAKPPVPSLAPPPDLTPNPGLNLGLNGPMGRLAPIYCLGPRSSGLNPRNLGGKPLTGRAWRLYSAASGGPTAFHGF